MNYEDRYEVSSLGNIRNVKTKRILKPNIGMYGYYFISLCRKGKRLSKRIHRLVAEAFVPNPENLETVDHIDNNPLNNNYLNLQ